MKGEQTAILAAGCFWGVEELLRQLPGVLATEVGYTGGDLENPSYEDVRTGRTGHAEALRIDFDPQVISFETLLREHFFKFHDPTTKNRQGGDRGTQYRSAIFFTTAEQETVAQRVIHELEERRVWPAPIVTEVTAARDFYTAEEEHQEYLKKNPGGYTCHFYRR